MLTVWRRHLASQWQYGRPARGGCVWIPARSPAKRVRAGEDEQRTEAHARCPGGRSGREFVRTMARGKYKEWLTEDGLKKLAEMAPRLTDAEMAREMGVSSSTYYDWLKRYPEMSEAGDRAGGGAERGGGA